MDNYSAGFSLLLIALMECLVISYAYGKIRLKFKHVFKYLLYYVFLLITRGVFIWNKIQSYQHEGVDAEGKSKVQSWPLPLT